MNEGFFAQYWNWLKAALGGNLGNSLFNNETVASGIAARFPVTLSVAAGGMIIAILIGLPAGIMSGLHQGTARDRGVTVGSSLAVAIPDFWLAMILIIVFAVKLGMASRARLHTVHAVARPNGSRISCFPGSHSVSAGQP